MMTMKQSQMTLDERDIQGQGSQEVEVEGCNDHIW